MNEEEEEGGKRRGREEAEGRVRDWGIPPG